MTEGTEVDFLRTVFVLTTDPLHFWSSRLSLDQWSEESHRLNRLEVDRNDAELVNGLERADSSLIDAERLNVHSTLKSGGTRMDTRVSEILEQEA